MGSEQLHLPGLAGGLAADRWVASDEQGVVLLLHGGGQTRHSWHRSGARFAAAGWTTIALDARGHGDSAWAPDGDYSMDALVADLAQVVTGLAVEPVLVGASMGGITSLVAVGEKAVVARALVLVDVAPQVEPAGVQRILDFMASAPDGFASLEEVADAIAAYNPHRPRPRNLDGLRKNVRQWDDGRWHWHWDPAFLTVRDEPSRATQHERLKAAAASVVAPTMLVRGTQSDVVSAEGAEELQRLIPHATVREAKAGHMVAGDDNDVFAQQVVQFLDDSLT
ncbi:MAG: alpha/beta hydrolase [Aeromicrobium sp.]|uniref:alpha/beta fold hydrolase n=1 Tax=Aeromicrobium sp. TaxID=1871063 RepID=UPI0025C623AA|nr:alpha/beta hydrolase [Aeromicrobium sp.]MCK5892445.1 alpha/beta fold hydrolase [Aeromicrobium sp.]MDF1704050.1 alpha/beta hydrolase [Aeromicrobium sp.]